MGPFRLLQETGGRASCCAALELPLSLLPLHVQLSGGEAGQERRSCCSIPSFGLLQNWWPRSIQRRMVLERATARFAAQSKSSARLFSRITEQLAENIEIFLPK